jgi:nucleoid-associated protein YgaU
MAGAEAFPPAPVTGNAPQQAPVQVQHAGGEAQALAAEPAAVPEQTLLPEQTAASDVTPPAAFHPGWQPAAPVMSPGMLAGPATRDSAQEVEPQVEGVTVHAGESLWDIAARHLGPGASDLDIALHWPRWYEANRELIGRNPDVLLPGQILQPPLSGQN